MRDTRKEVYMGLIGGKVIPRINLTNTSLCVTHIYLSRFLSVMNVMAYAAAVMAASAVKSAAPASARAAFNSCLCGVSSLEYIRILREVYRVACKIYPRVGLALELIIML